MEMVNYRLTRRIGFMKEVSSNGNSGILEHRINWSVHSSDLDSAGKCIVGIVADETLLEKIRNRVCSERMFEHSQSYLLFADERYRIISFYGTTVETDSLPIPN